MENAKTIDEKCRVLAAKYLERRGYEILDAGQASEDVPIVALDEDTLVFCHVEARKPGQDLMSREEEASLRVPAERFAAQWLASHPDGPADCMMRFDSASFLVVGEDRAILRHSINVLGAAC